MGVYSEWQPRYAERGIATFPVRPNKTPAVRGYLKVGSAYSAQLALKFFDADAFGLVCGHRNRITVLDVDTNDERMLADGLDRHGQTPFIVRSGSGNYQAWYRFSGERRHVRPDPARSRRRIATTPSRGAIRPPAARSTRTTAGRRRRACPSGTTRGSRSSTSAFVA